MLLDPLELEILEKASVGYGPYDVQLRGNAQRYHAAERLAERGLLSVFNDLQVAITEKGKLAIQEHHNCMKQISKAEAENKKADRRKLFVKLAFVLISVIGTIIAALIPVFIH